MDELERRRHGEAMAFAFLTGLLLITSYALLATFDPAQLSNFYLAPAMVFCWNIGLLLAVARYR
jgi:hypothetical protein